MTEKRFGYGAGVNWQEDVIIDYETEKSYNFYEVGKLLDELTEENENITLLAQHNYEESKRIINRYVDKIKELERKNKELKSLCKVLITHIEKNSIAFVIDEDVRRLLE